jgi:hypothetical protein
LTPWGHNGETSTVTADKLVTEAHLNMPVASPSLADVDRRLRQMLCNLLAAFDYEAEADSSPAHICRALAVILAEVEDLQRMH